MKSIINLKTELHWYLLTDNGLLTLARKAQLGVKVKRSPEMEL